MKPSNLDLQIQEAAGAFTQVIEKMGYKNVHVFWYGEMSHGPVSGVSRKENLHPFLSLGILENIKNQVFLNAANGSSRNNHKPWS